MFESTAACIPKQCGIFSKQVRTIVKNRHRSVNLDKHPLAFIGDPQGCAHELQQMIERTNHNSQRHFIILGDLVGKGPKSAAVIKLVRSLGSRCHCVMGNWDQRLLQACYKIGRLQKISSISSHEIEIIVHNFGNKSVDSIADDSELVVLAQQMTLEEIDFFAHLPLTLSIKWRNPLDCVDHYFVAVHAGIHPHLQLSDNTPQTNLYMRNVIVQNLDLEIKDNHSEGVPWFQVYNDISADEARKRPITFYGHDAKRGLQKHAMTVGLDTGCCYGKQLSAYLLPEHCIEQINALRIYQSVS